MQMDWERDFYLGQLSGRIEDYDMVSFDVFDTLLFRLCAEPDDIFELVGEHLKETVEAWPYAPVTYKWLRKEAGQRAQMKKTNGEECSIADILAEMPFSSSFVQLLAVAELVCEEKATYLNCRMYSFIQHLVSKNIIIVLTSDMYFSKEQILGLLVAAGVDTGVVSECFVSSEHGCCKTTGGLFHKVLASYPDIDPSRVLHIGDNIYADVEGAQRAGIHAFHYCVIPDDFGSLYDYERFVLNSELGELMSLRKYAASNIRSDTDQSEAAIFQLGAEVIGPVLALYADWIVQYAEEQKISVILPFMREGELLSVLINRSAVHHNYDIECTPLYISRQAAFIADFYSDNYDERISQLLMRGARPVSLVFNDLGLDSSDFQGRTDCSMDLTLDILRQKGLFDDLLSYLKSSEVKQSVLALSETQRSRLLRYMSGIMKGRSALTVDNASRGTTERHLNDIWLRENGLPGLQNALLIAPGFSHVSNILDGINIVAWLGIAGENNNLINKLINQMNVIELLVNATCGSVLRYEETKGDVVAELEPDYMPETQKRLVKTCWKGVYAFQDEWFSLSNKKPWLRHSLLKKKESFLSILIRFIEMPTTQEAMNLDELVYSEYFSYGCSRVVEIVKPSGNDFQTDDEIKAFITTSLKDGAHWPQAGIALTNNAYFKNRLLYSIDSDPSVNAIVSVLREVKSQNFEYGIVFGAAELGRKFNKFASKLDVRIAFFVDSDVRLHGTYVDGIEVIPLSKAAQVTPFIVIASYTYKDQIHEILRHHYQGAEHIPKFYFIAPNQQ